jgi:hypothetical protein
MAVRRLDEYLEAEIQRLLTEDVDVAEQGITVVRRDQALLVSGEVESPHRRDAILHRLAEAFPDVPIECDIGIIRAQAPSEAEELS